MKLDLITDSVGDKWVRCSGKIGEIEVVGYGTNHSQAFANAIQAYLIQCQKENKK